MQFYGREAELQIMEDSYERLDSSAQMLVITGRRRIGKTLLSLKYIENKKHLFLFIAKKSEKLLCQEFLKQIKEQVEIPLFGEIFTFKEVFALILEMGKKEPLVVVIDEFQEFIQINPSIFSDIQHLWDMNKFKTKVQLIFLGSVYSLMHRIFQSSKEPLFGRADHLLSLKPFSVSEMHKILTEYGQASAEVLFNYYLATGGTPKYIDILLGLRAFSQDEIFSGILSTHSPFLEEGKNVLIEEFGKEYGVYFSILELISMGKTSRAEIESVIQKNVGGYLERLEETYSVIKKYRPIDAKPNTRLQKFYIKDLFLNFWFRFINRHKTAIETGNFSFVREVLAKNIETYSGRVLEHFFIDLFSSQQKYNRIGSYWERGNQNEIDLVAINDLEKRVVIAEVKMNKSRIRLSKVEEKAKRLLAGLPGYKVQFMGLSLESTQDYLLQ